MACVDAATAKVSTTTKSLITLSSSVKSAKGGKRQLPTLHLARTENTRLGYRQPTNRAWLKAQALFDRCQDGRTLVLNEDDEKLRRVCLAGVATDNVNVVRTFMTRVKGDRLLPLC